MANNTPTKLYRYTRNIYVENGIGLYLHECEVISETPAGYWAYTPDGKKWISKTSRKRYAYPTKEEALTGYIARTKRYIRLLQAQLNAAKECLKIAQTPNFKYEQQKSLSYEPW